MSPTELFVREEIGDDIDVMDPARQDRARDDEEGVDALANLPTTNILPVFGADGKPTIRLKSSRLAPVAESHVRLPVLWATRCSSLPIALKKSLLHEVETERTNDARSLATRVAAAALRLRSRVPGAEELTIHPPSRPIRTCRRTQVCAAKHIQ